MTIIKRTVQVHFAVLANSSIEDLGSTYVNMTNSDMSEHGWSTIAVKDIDVSINTEKFIETTLAGLDKAEAKLRAEFQKHLEELKTTRANLLSLPAPTPQPNVIDFVNATLDPVEAEARSFTDCFYVTYGGNTCQRSNFSRVYAVDYDAARILVFEEIGDKFAGFYTEAEFDGQVEAYGLTEIPLTAHVVSPF